jgi:hypothetical protein
MRSVAVCPKCIEEQAQKGMEPRPAPLVGELDDCGYIKVRCELGHEGIVIYNARRYNVLAESAARAFVDGYTNEVVAVMAAALERSYEFYIRVSCAAKSMAPELIEHAWKGVAAQSERQYGAFQFLYSLDHASAFRLDDSVTKTGNNVVHKGRIASESEALRFAENVYAVIRGLERTIEDKFSKYAADEAAREVAMQQSLVPDGTPYVTLKKQTVRYDKAKKEVTGVVEKFVDLAGAVVQSRSMGFPA